LDELVSACLVALEHERGNRRACVAVLSSEQLDRLCHRVQVVHVSLHIRLLALQIGNGKQHGGEHRFHIARVGGRKRFSGCGVDVVRVVPHKVWQSVCAHAQDLCVWKHITLW
jgi:hypothetical protein